MKILVTGATGFLASQFVTDLIASGHAVTCCVRQVQYAERIFPAARVIPCNFEQDTNVECWLPRLADIDIVINCVGILYHPLIKKVWNIHYHTPRAMFEACQLAGVKQIIQISALGIEKSSAAYARSKIAAEDFLLSLPVKSVILRPSLVYGNGSYGGTSLFRGFAGLPGLIPVPGPGKQKMQPIHLQDLSQGIIKLISSPPDRTVILHAVGPDQVTFLEIIRTLRAWLGFAAARFIFIPLKLIKMTARIGDILPGSVLNSTSYSMMIQDNTTSKEETQKFQQLTGLKPRTFGAGIQSQPSTVQDRWHARLYFIKPLLKYSIAFIWLFSAVCSVFFYPRPSSYHLLAQTGIPEYWQPLFLTGAAGLDALIGLAMLCSYRLKQTCFIQIIVIVIYTAIISWKLPYLWLEPFGPIAKNIPLLAAILTFFGMESDR